MFWVELSVHYWLPSNGNQDNNYHDMEGREGIALKGEKPKEELNCDLKGSLAWVRKALADWVGKGIIQRQVFGMLDLIMLSQPNHLVSVTFYWESRG